MGFFSPIPSPSHQRSWRGQCGLVAPGVKPQQGSLIKLSLSPWIPPFLSPASSPAFSRVEKETFHTQKVDYSQENAVSGQALPK